MWLYRPNERTWGGSRVALIVKDTRQLHALGQRLLCKLHGQRQLLCAVERELASPACSASGPLQQLRVVVEEAPEQRHDVGAQPIADPLQQHGAQRRVLSLQHQRTDHLGHIIALEVALVLVERQQLAPQQVAVDPQPRHLELFKSNPDCPWEREYRYMEDR